MRASVDSSNSNNSLTGIFALVGHHVCGQEGPRAFIAFCSGSNLDFSSEKIYPDRSLPVTSGAVKDCLQLLGSVGSINNPGPFSSYHVPVCTLLPLSLTSTIQALFRVTWGGIFEFHIELIGWKVFMRPIRSTCSGTSNSCGTTEVRVI